MMRVSKAGVSKAEIEFLQACARSFADTLRFVYCHNIGEYYDIQYSIDVLQQNKINRIEESKIDYKITKKKHMSKLRKAIYQVKIILIEFFK